MALNELKNEIEKNSNKLYEEMKNQVTLYLASNVEFIYIFLIKIYIKR